MNDDGEDGMVTAEAAVALPAVAVLLAGALAVVVAVDQRLSCVDAAHTGVRVAARGQPDADVQAAVSRLLPHARATVARTGGLVTVTVTEAVDLPVVHGVTITERATAIDETSLPP